MYVRERWYKTNAYTVRTVEKRKRNEIENKKRAAALGKKNTFPLK